MALGLLIGLALGAVGGGGAVLALPVLVYLLDQPIGTASTASLVVVVAAAAAGAFSVVRRDHVCWRIALVFSASAAGASVIGAFANAAVSELVLVLAFVPIMAVAAAAMWRRTAHADADAAPGCPPTSRMGVCLPGLGVGLLTGFLGVGGGFLIVPVLRLGLGVDLRRAVATSLIIIGLTGVAALSGHLAAGATIDVELTAGLATATGVGAATGATLGGRLPQAILARAFSLVVAASALALLADALLDGVPGG